MTSVDHARPDRLEAVRRYEILDAPSDGTFERVAEIAAANLGTSVGLVTIVDIDRVWFAASHGIEGVTEVGAEPGLCTSVVLQDGPYIVADALCDPRTQHHPLVSGEFGLRFYAAAPIITTDGHRLGTVNAIDYEPRNITPAHTAMLTALAAIVSDHLELRLATLTAVREERRLRADAEERMADSIRFADKLRAAAAEYRHIVSFPGRCQLGEKETCSGEAELKSRTDGATPHGDVSVTCKKS